MVRSMRSITSLASLVCALLAALSLAGCADGRPAGQARGSLAARTALSAGSTALLIKSGSYYADEQALNAAESELTQHCMVRLGFRYPAQATLDPMARDEQWRPDLAARRRYGYDLAAHLTAQPAALAAGDRYQRSLSPARRARYRRALFGSMAQYEAIDLPGGQFSFPAHGCIAASQDRLYGSPVTAARVFYLPQVLFNSVYVAVQRTPGYRHVLSAWAGCMSQHGYRYSSPSDAERQLADRYHAGEPPAAQRAAQRLEIAVAVQDAKCAGQVRVPEVTQALLLCYAARLPAAQRQALNSVAAARDTAAGRARQILSSVAAGS
jgi:hypothetical protein